MLLDSGLTRLVEAGLASRQNTSASEEQKPTEQPQVEVTSSTVTPVLDFSEPKRKQPRNNNAMAKQTSNLGRRWYAIHTYSGYEENVTDSLKRRIATLDERQNFSGARAHGKR